MRCHICHKRIWFWQKHIIVEEVKEVDENGIPLDFINPHEYNIHSNCNTAG